MHDAPLISPENKDTGVEVLAGLPKVTLYQELPSTAASPAELRSATRAAVEALAADHVLYAELCLRPEAYGFPAEEALDAAVAGAKVPGIEAAIILTANAQGGRAEELAQLSADPRVAGFMLDATDARGAELEDLSSGLRASFVPWQVLAGDFAGIEAAVTAGAQRLVRPVDLIDDFSADLEGVRPGRVSVWVRDRHLAVTMCPLWDANEDLDLSDHPLPLLQQLGFTCSIASGQAEAGSLTEQFVALSETFGYGLEEFFDLTVKAVENSFMNEEDRQRLLEEEILPAYEKLADAEFAEDEHREELDADD
ncbi:adenosine deaminase [Corynebacterium sp.]|uniref:adenosine deaminase n=1 Tax=Corynebacterium sp. TaxID=1720 RepID=UPI0026DC31FD|nr:adenosine deaminase [Corynebacterium sp.]MDO5031175.1 adenosine deaminase [Corynebacterium sp.]